MTCAERIRAIRLMEKMEESSSVKREADGSMKYIAENGNVMVEAKMRKVNA